MKLEYTSRSANLEIFGQEAGCGPFATFYFWLPESRRRIPKSIVNIQYVLSRDGEREI